MATCGLFMNGTMKMTNITTDNKWKQFKYGYEVPEKVLSDQFDWMGDDEKTDGFFTYRKAWYHISEFMRLGNSRDEDLCGWQAYLSDSAFSGLLLQVSNDGEEYKVATFIS